MAKKEGGKEKKVEAGAGKKISAEALPMWAKLGLVVAGLMMVAWGITAATATGPKAAAAPRKMDDATRERYRDAAREMFYHSYDSYLTHAFPKDELAPIACKGHDTHNCHGCLLTFYDALDTLVVLDNSTEFQRVVRWLAEHGAAAFDRDQTVSVFETNIRVLGSLISNHLLAQDEKLNLMPGYQDELLTLALDIGNRLLRAYSTPTGLPWGSISLKTGPKFGETPISGRSSASPHPDLSALPSPHVPDSSPRILPSLTATATGGTVLLEFILLSQARLPAMGCIPAS